ncbi:DUF1287 domain-containing protein [Cocleimonas flava]|uniref:Uncharacterized protein YijF (DUF1287 family) n=1 Tax=Cocleimonas flava TaxID=634765 RepID=A0A4R1F2N2_9GAMM|nr:DUF1287 domain-containing protein [Cocleimonas flava]TCJ84621.1 uncharacterized protein YijF (DUF1287 family) [Cocleimonas flava]
MKSTQHHVRTAILLLALIVGLVATVQLSSIKHHIFKDDTLNGDAIIRDVIIGDAIIDDVNIDQSTKPSHTQLTTDQQEIDVEPERELTFQDHLAIQAELRLQSNVRYDGSYRKIAYPMGDVPADIGVCTDVVIRSFRGLGIDLQQRVHEDMKRNFRSYPNKWKLSKPDTNIDHRRVPNLMTFFERAGASLPISDDPMDYLAGNVVAWDLSKPSGSSAKGTNMVHIGIVSNYVSEHTSNPLIVHNIGGGPQMNDMLFDFKIIGHYKSEALSPE